MSELKQPAGSAGHLAALTGIRGIAAWMVVIYHMRLSLTGILSEPAIAFFAKGYLAVDLFFMLSGFVMWLNYGPKFRANGLGQTRSFWWKRFARVWPLHALILASMVAFALMLLVMGRDASGYPFTELPLHVMLIQNWGFTSELSWNHPAWSISTEMGAYLLFPLIACSVKWEELPSAVIVAIVAGLFAALTGIFGAFGYIELGDDIARLGLIRCVLEFCAGIALCILWQRWRNHSWSAFLCLAVGGIIIFAGALLGLPETAVIPPVFAAFLLFLALDKSWFGRVLGCASLRWLGDISYATYLSHFFLFVLFKIVFVGDDMQVGWMGLLAYLAIVLAASAVLFHAFEKPAQRWLNVRTPGYFRIKPIPPVR